MELVADQPSRGDDAGEAPSVLGLGQHHRRVSRLRHVGMDEVDRGAVGDAREERVGALEVQAVPADVRQARRVRKAHHVAGQQSQQACAVLLGVLEQQLHAQADAHQPGTGLGCLAQRAQQTLATQSCHRRPAGADPWQDDHLGVDQILGPPADIHIGTHRQERVADADKVAGTVVHQRGTDRGCLTHWGHAREPLVEGTPTRRGSSVTAARRARAIALKAASAM